MTGSSRMPVSLRESFNQVKRRRPTSLSAVVNLDLLRNIIFLLFVLRWTRRAFWQLRGRGIIGSLVELYRNIGRILYGYFLRAPGVRGKVQKQVSDALAKTEAKLVPTNLTKYLTLPKEGLSDDDVRKELEMLANLDHTKWEEGYVSGAVYHGEQDLIKLQTEAFGTFTVANPIHPDVFPGVRKMEAEIVSMVLALFNAPPDAAGTTTAGGTESILVCCLAARQKAYAERGITEPEMIIPETAHVAFRKAGDYFKIKVHRVPCPAPSYQVDMKAVARLVNPNTILLVGSAPNYPHGMIDDIAALSKIAVKRKIWLHVDCCLGSFVIPYLEKAGFESQPFDFRLKGVASISCDTHKYGFAPKGNSTALYRSAQHRSYQYYVSPDWPGGVYALIRMGDNGYLDACGKLVGTAKKIADKIRETPSKNLNIYDIYDGMTTKGWHLNALQDPPAIHVAVTVPIVKVWETLMADLESVIEAEKEKERARIAQGKGASKPVGDSAALYGVAGSLPNKGVVVDLAAGFLDLLYKT
ncbi:unnamed protein product [Parascedosporium putredinis]|uniref:sphinganine-1-phosphate aldolase n=1 Tax=Parascedosporium putredinis TaxID=1442378 RepID=A0A9P1H8Q2_9PEZI|nr:unnamed protein product [Parascedosporium putredinis]CAI7999628.1 unnamed protein product [Parascedosporium putredinis]